jgi:hypothetical protein
VTGDKLLQYLGLRRAPGAERTTADRAFTVILLVGVVATLFLTRNLGFWPQIAVLAVVAVGLGVVGGATLTTLAARRSRTTDE